MTAAKCKWTNGGSCQSSLVSGLWKALSSLSLPTCTRIFGLVSVVCVEYFGFRSFERLGFPFFNLAAIINFYDQQLLSPLELLRAFWGSGYLARHQHC